MQIKPIDIIRLDAVQPQRWFNGGGRTREIATGAGNPDWDWRLSVADVESDGPFSHLPDIEREIYLLEGAGMQFDFEDGDAHALTPESPRFRFDGGRGLYSRLIDGPTRDFNLMWRRGRVDAELWRRPMVGSMVVFAEAREIWVVHLLAGSAQVADGSGQGDGLARGDTVLIRAGDERRRCAVEGAGEALVIRIAPASGVIES